MLLPARKFSETARSFRNFPWKLFSRFIGGQLIVTICLLAVAGLSARFIFRSWFLSQSSTQAHATLVSLSRDLRGGGELSQWCAGHSGGALTFTILTLADRRPICSTISSEVLMNGKDLVRSPENADPVYGASLSRDRGTKIPVLVASLDVPAQRVTLRAALSLPQLGEALVFFDRSLAAVLFLVASAFTGCSVLMGRRLMFPLGRLIVKARRVLPDQREPESQDEIDDSDTEDPGDGEWTDLETTLDQIRWNLRHKTETLTREREELATLMSAISDAILAVDSAGNPLFYNSRFALLFGERDLAVKRPRLGELFRAPEVLSAFGAALKDGQPQQASAKLHVGNDPIPHYFSLSIAPLRKDGGEVYGAVGIFHDVTELKRAEQIRIDFVANVSHELRTPVTAILSAAETMEMALAKDPEGAKRFLGIPVGVVATAQAGEQDSARRPQRGVFGMVAHGDVEGGDGLGGPAERLAQHVGLAQQGRQVLRVAGQRLVEVGERALRIVGKAGKASGRPATLFDRFQLHALLAIAAAPSMSLSWLRDVARAK